MIRKITGSLLFTFMLYSASAQETVKQKYRLTPSVMEIFQVLKTDKNIKQGLYQAAYRHSTAIASGEYNNNKKIGIWHFYDIKGKLIENFDYDNTKLLYEEPIDSVNRQLIGYAFDVQPKDSDRLTKPIKIGGRCYGYIPYIKIYQLPQSFTGVDLSGYTGIIELLVSPGGRLADFKEHIRSATYAYTTSFSPELIDEEDRMFIPATLNHKPVLSRIFLRCRLTPDGRLDVD